MFSGGLRLKGYIFRVLVCWLNVLGAQGQTHVEIWVPFKGLQRAR